MYGFKRYQEIAQKYKRDAFVSYMAEKILSHSNKTIDKNYLLIRDCPFPYEEMELYNHIKRSDLDDFSDKVKSYFCNSNYEYIKNIAINYEVKPDFLLEVYEQIGNIDKVIFVIRCVIHDKIARNSAFMLTEYMRRLKCKYGMIMSPTAAFIYEDKKAELVEQVGSELDLNNDKDVTTFINFVNNIN